MAHALPAAVEAAIGNLRDHKTGLSQHDVSHAITKAAEASPPADEAEKNAYNAEIAAFNFSGENEETSVWGSHFGPIATWRGQDGRTILSPDIANLAAGTIQYWRARAAGDLHPVIKAR